MAQIGMAFRRALALPLDEAYLNEGTEPHEFLHPGQLWFDQTAQELKIYKNGAFVAMSPVTVSSSMPAGTLGQLWYDTTIVGAPHLKIHDGTTFVAVDAAVPHVGSTAPLNAYSGQLWYDTSDSLLKIFNTTEFVTVQGVQAVTFTLDDTISSRGFSFTIAEGAQESDMIVTNPAFNVNGAPMKATAFAALSLEQILQRLCPIERTPAPTVSFGTSRFENASNAGERIGDNRQFREFGSQVDIQDSYTYEARRGSLTNAYVHPFKVDRTKFFQDTFAPVSQGAIGAATADQFGIDFTPAHQYASYVAPVATVQVSDTGHISIQFTSFGSGFLPPMEVALFVREGSVEELPVFSNVECVSDDTQSRELIPSNTTAFQGDFVVSAPDDTTVELGTDSVTVTDTTSFTHTQINTNKIIAQRTITLQGPPLFFNATLYDANGNEKSATFPTSQFKIGAFEFEMYKHGFYKTSERDTHGTTQLGNITTAGQTPSGGVAIITTNGSAGLTLSQSTTHFDFNMYTQRATLNPAAIPMTPVTHDHTTQPHPLRNYEFFLPRFSNRKVTAVKWLQTQGNIRYVTLTEVMASATSYSITYRDDSTAYDTFSLNLDNISDYTVMNELDIHIRFEYGPA